MSKCTYAKTNQCSLYRLDSYTCNHNGGNYCGRYRDLKFGKVKEVALHAK